MENFFTFLEKHQTGVLLLVVLIFTIVLTIRWLFKIFGLGKYKTHYIVKDETGKEKLVKVQQKDENPSITYVLTQSLVDIVGEFRHFLALLIVLLFIILIIVAMWLSSGATDVNFENMMDAMQLVIASLGGLLGSIIGYYYGESAARSNKEGITTDAGEISNAPSAGEGDIVAPTVPSEEEVIEVVEDPSEDDDDIIEPVGE
ncbi:hypothetical protein POV27_02660 [Aureisphaera galaxeae]|uniref:hypothetical protein n=1 Tax=Aureisphaera galaxeae TaxID=1538023 RepID=UPI00234FF883|nr:hypothetical protein [Aureisphaera galaxeae]MDC8002933.1 hypothetical protein [Aureisphaera galaxeae]